MDRQDFERVVPELRLKLQRIALFYLADDDAPLPIGQKSRSRIVTNGRFLSGTIQRPTCDTPSSDACVPICNQLYMGCISSE